MHRTLWRHWSRNYFFPPVTVVTVSLFHIENSPSIAPAIVEDASPEVPKMAEEEKKRIICEKAAQATIILNYIAFLFETESHSQLKQVFKMKLYVYELFHSLSLSPPKRGDDGDTAALNQLPEDEGGLTHMSEDQEKLAMGVLANTFNMPVFCYHGKEGAQHFISTYFKHDSSPLIVLWMYVGRSGKNATANSYRSEE